MAELAGGLAHELRNPLSTMMVNLKLLAEDLQDASAQPEDVRRRALLKVEVLRREAERLQALFDDFLRATGPYRLQRSPIDLRVLIRRVAEFFRPLASGHKVELFLELGDTPLVCPVDEKLMNQALLNLVINAQEAMPDGGRLHVSIGRETDEAIISVSDTGIGISPEQHERIMRPFYSNKADGTGLGLSITRRVIEEHGGTIGFTSEPGKGTIFTIRLPISEKLETRD